MAFFAVTLMGSIFFLPLEAAFMVSLISAVVEIFSGKYDNLAIPFTAAFMASIFLKLFNSLTRYKIWKNRKRL